MRRFESVRCTYTYSNAYIAYVNYFICTSHKFKLIWLYVFNIYIILKILNAEINNTYMYLSTHISRHMFQTLTLRTQQ